MMSINDWSDGVCGFVAGLSSDAVRRVPDHGDMRRDWLDGYNAAQAMDHVLKGSIAAVKAAEEWAHAPQGKVNQGQAAAAQNQETGQHPTDQWPGRTMHYGDRLTALERDIKTIFGCLDAQSKRLNQHEARLDRIDGQIRNRLDAQRERMDVHAQRITILEQAFKTHEHYMMDHSRVLSEHGERMDALTNRIERAVRRLTSVEHRQISMERYVTSPEARKEGER